MFFKTKSTWTDVKVWIPIVSEWRQIINRSLDGFDITFWKSMSRIYLNADPWLVKPTLTCLSTSDHVGPDDVMILYVKPLRVGAHLTRTEPTLVLLGWAQLQLSFFSMCLEQRKRGWDLLALFLFFCSLSLKGSEWSCALWLLRSVEDGRRWR